MGCGSCGSGGCSTGGCGGGCATGGCNKLNTFDWLGNMFPPYISETENVYEVRFKNTHKGFYKNVNGLRLNIGDWVVVEGDRGGYDIGQISLGGVLAKLQLAKRSLSKPTISKLYRRANDNDLNQLNEVRSREKETLNRSRQIIYQLKLDMKLSDVEYQGDGSKATFYYIADARVDFRELIKLLAKEFKIRVEMKQIGLRHEAALLGGIGVCGRELCCSTWLTEFKVVVTAAARYQNLSLNPAKISGLCGRLKCCLNYELDAYKDALRDFPDVDRLHTETGTVHLQKTDIFRYKMWFAYENETTWYPLDVSTVKKYREMNKSGQKAPTLSTQIVDESEDNKFVNATQQEPDKSDRNNRQKGRPDRKKNPERKERSASDKPQNREQRPPQDKEQRPNREQRPPQNREQRPPQNKEQRPPQNREQRPPVNREQRPPQNKEQRPPENKEQRPPENKEQRPPEKRVPPPPQNKQQPPQDGDNPPPPRNNPNRNNRRR